MNDTLNIPITDYPMPSPQQILQDEQFMRLAITAAREAMALGEVPVGAVVVLDGVVIATAHNRTRLDHDPTAHAEVLALRAASKVNATSRLDGATLYVSVEPCTMCAGALLQARIKRLVFGASEAKTGGVISIAETLMNPANTHPIAVTQGVLAADASALMSQFFRYRREL